MLEFQRLLSTEKTPPYDTVAWEKTDIKIIAEDGHIVFSLEGGEFPATWSDNARKIAASKYFKAPRTGNEKPETSVRSMIERVVVTVEKAGIDQDYFSPESGAIFADELRMVFLHQMASPNSPVWFNVGIAEEPQVSACFISEIGDSMVSIMEAAKTSGLIFKEGSGVGMNVSSLRGSNERVRGGGFASGPASFLQGFDAFANVILSGGRVRRAARAVVLDIDHPDAPEFAVMKVTQEEIAEVLVSAGFSADFSAPNNAYSLVRHQSANNSLRVSDEWMAKARAITHGYSPDELWELKNRVDPSPNKKVSLQKLFHTAAESAWRCGDPGLMFSGAVDRAHTCAVDGNIVSGNPCFEFLFMNNTACNLASINLERFAKDDRTFDIKLFKHVVRLMICMQEVLVDFGHYPTEEIRLNSSTYRPLGLGYTALGSLLMRWGLPYDSQQGRALAASITSLLTATAYATSAELAGIKGPFAAYARNKECMENVLDAHYAATRKLEKDVAGISGKAIATWQDVLGKGFGRRKGTEEGTGFRNAQATCLAPTATISWILDAPTMGIEPDIALRKTKLLVGGNRMTYVNPGIEQALKNLGYDDSARKILMDYVTEHGHFESSALSPAHLSVFDCALPVGTRSISVDGHINMMAAVQPFLSGGISKTVNVENSATVDTIERIFIRAWEAGLKSISVFRDHSKLSSPMRVKEVKERAKAQNIPQRMQLPDDVEQAPRHKFSVSGHTGYLHVGLHPETKKPIEIFVRLARFGSTVGGLLDSYAVLMSKALQFGIPLENLVSHMIGSKFPPAGFTTNPDIRSAGSILDYLGRYLQKKYLGGTTENPETTPDTPDLLAPADDSDASDVSGETCPDCGALLRTAGACRTCTNCAYSSGVCG